MHQHYTDRLTPDSRLQKQTPPHPTTDSIVYVASGVTTVAGSNFGPKALCPDLNCFVVLLSPSMQMSDSNLN
jgi:hypothetical protein